MKEYITNVLTNAINEGKIQNNNSYDTAFLKEIVKKVNNNQEYFYEYILELNSDLLKELIDKVEPESARESFLASIIYLKNLTEINKKEDVSIPLSKNQEEILYELFELIKKIVELDNTNEKEEKKYYKKYGQKYQKLLDKINNNKVLCIEDYDLIDELIKKYEKENIDKVLNNVMDYLNTHNYRLLPKLEIDSNQITFNEEEPEIEISEENEEVIITGVEESLKEDKIEPAEPKINFDIFKPHSFVLEEEPKRVKKRKNKVNKEEPKEIIEQNEHETNLKDNIIYEEKKDEINKPDISNEINADNFEKTEVKIEDNSTVEETITDDFPLSSIGISKLDLNEYCLNLIDIGINESALNYFLQNLKSQFINDNYNSIVSLVCLSDEESLKEIFDYFKEINLNETIVKDLLNRATQIFFTKNKGAFKENAMLALSYNADLEKLIKTNITYFYNSPEYNKNKINLLENAGLNINLLFSNKPQILAISLDKLLKNIDMLNKYSINITPEDYESLSIISSPNLNIMIDTFIETGFSSYLIGELKNIRSLIIKRIFYAFKNNLSVWCENITDNRINDEYEEWISKERKTLTDEEMNYLISDYPVLEYLEASKRPAFFTDASAASIKRKYEFRFGNNIISRYKVYSIFNVLINHNVNEKEALFYAITYNSNLIDDDYNAIKKEILGK